jgi:hypothetical protein
MSIYAECDIQGETNLVGTHAPYELLVLAGRARPDSETTSFRQLDRKQAHTRATTVDEDRLAFLELCYLEETHPCRLCYEHDPRRVHRRHFVWTFMQEIAVYDGILRQGALLRDLLRWEIDPSVHPITNRVQTGAGGDDSARQIMLRSSKWPLRNKVGLHLHECVPSTCIYQQLF